MTAVTLRSIMATHPFELFTSTVLTRFSSFVSHRGSASVTMFVHPIGSTDLAPNHRMHGNIFVPNSPLLTVYAIDEDPDKSKRIV
jgi:hypothetical protein